MILLLFGWGDLSFAIMSIELEGWQCMLGLLLHMGAKSSAGSDGLAIPVLSTKVVPFGTASSYAGRARLTLPADQR